MKRLVGYGLVAWLALTTTLASQGQNSPTKAKAPPPEANAPGAGGAAASPAERYRDVLKAFQKDQTEFMEAYRAAKTDAERVKIAETRYPATDKYGDKMLKIAQDAPKDPVAVEALIWVSLNSVGPKSEQAMKILVTDHIENPKISSLCAGWSMTIRHKVRLSYVRFWPETQAVMPRRRHVSLLGRG